MVEIKETKRKMNFPVKIYLNGEWQYFTEKACKEIRTFLNDYFTRNEKNKVKILQKCCIHAIGDDRYETYVPDMEGLYVAYTCPKCGDSIKDYYELANRYNESKEKEELIPDSD